MYEEYNLYIVNIFAILRGIRVSINCPVCGSSGADQYYDRGETDYVKCKNCNIVWRNPIPDIQKLKEIYSEAYIQDNIDEGKTQQESGTFAIKTYASYLSNKYIHKNDKILDFGAGTGCLVADLRHMDYLIDGYEFSEEARNYCKRVRKISLYDTVENLPKNIYQKVLLIEVIEHFTDPFTSIKDIYHCLNAGGTIFITTPNRSGLRSMIEGGHWKEATKKFHLFLFNGSSLTCLLILCGFVEIEVIRFPPIVKPGIVNLLWGRLTQLLGIGGTLCVSAKRP
jgi:2-polyprenyl-3-methyl-5-hydroxy-6-metoxy-1,4-benzoquinol methylase